MKETQHSIAVWSRKTFGPVRNSKAAARALKEMAELAMKLADDDDHPKAGEEVADIVICLIRIIDNQGLEIADEIDKKMRINRARKWKLDGAGCGQHIEEP